MENPGCNHCWHDVPTVTANPQRACCDCGAKTTFAAAPRMWHGPFAPRPFQGTFTIQPVPYVPPKCTCGTTGGTGLCPIHGGTVVMRFA